MDPFRQWKEYLVKSRARVKLNKISLSRRFYFDSVGLPETDYFFFGLRVK